MLLAVDKAEIPREFPDLARIIVILRIFDSRRNRFEAQFRLVADRPVLRATPEGQSAATVSAPLPTGRNPLAVPVTVVDEAAERARDAEFFRTDRGRFQATRRPCGGAKADGCEGEEDGPRVNFCPAARRFDFSVLACRAAGG